MTSADPQPDRFYVLGGTMMPNAASYVSRRADRELQDRVTAGDFCYVLTSRQMGKSSLMARSAKALREKGVQTAVVDLSAIGTAHDRISADQWCQSVAHRIARQLGLSVNLKSWWDERQHLATLTRLGEFFSDVVLHQTSGQVVIFLDEIDTTIHLQFKDDFFATIRACYNARATDSEYRRLVFVLLGVASPSDLIEDKQRTPFNIGHRIELTDFAEEEAKPLAEGLGQPARDATRSLQRILYWTGGHPYLTQRLCCEVARRTIPRYSQSEMDSVVHDAFLSPAAMREDHNLRFVYDRLLSEGGSDPNAHRRDILQLYWRVARGATVSDETFSPVCNALKLSGAVTVRSEGILRVRNRIYEEIFTSDWALQSLPIDWTRGDELRSDGNVTAAMAAYQEMLDIAKLRSSNDPTQPTQQREVAVGHEKIGELLVESADFEAGRRALQQALEIRRCLAELEPAQLGWLRDLAISQERMGGLLTKTGKLRQAENTYQDAVRIRQRLVDDDPGNQVWRSELVACWTKIGELRQQLGDFTTAVEAHRTALAGLEELTRCFPENARYGRELHRLRGQVSEMLAEGNRVERLALLSRITCPHCLEVFPPEDVLWIANHPDLLGDFRLGEDQPGRFLPTRFNVHGSAIDVKGTPCESLACPRCHLQLPRILLEMKPLFVSLLGGPGTGKSMFLASMTWRLRSQLHRMSVSFSDADPLANRRITENEQRLFIAANDGVSVILPKTELEGDLYQVVRFGQQQVRYPRPFVFAVRPLDPAHGSGAERASALCLYDMAGEHFLPGAETQALPTKQLAHSRILFFLFDPTQHPGFQRAWSYGKHTETAERGHMVRQDAILYETSQRIRSQTGLSQHQKIDCRLTVVLTKFDLWHMFIEDALETGGSFFNESQTALSLQLDFAMHVSRSMRELVTRYSPEIVSAAESIFSSVSYVPVSAAGVEDRTSHEQRTSSIHPLWTEVPMLLALHYASPGLIPVANHDEGHTPHIERGRTRRS